MLVINILKCVHNDTVFVSLFPQIMKDSIYSLSLCHFNRKCFICFFSFHFFALYWQLAFTNVSFYSRFFFTSSLGHADDIQIVNPESFDLLIGKLWNMLKSFKENWYFHFFYSFEWFFFAFFKDWIKVKWFLCFSFDEVNKRSQVAYKIRYLNKFMSTEQRSTSTKFWNK